MTKPPTLATQIYNQIKSDILKCVISPGARLTESQLVTEYNAGRAAVRSALKMLSQEALVDALPRYGYLVADHSELDARNLYQLQILLEPEIARLATGRINLVELQKANDECVKLHHSISNLDDASRWLHANTRFHTLVASYTGNALMQRFVAILFERLERQLYAKDCLEEAVRLVSHEHSSLIEALSSNDPNNSARLSQIQVGHVHNELLTFFKETAGP